MAVIIKEFNTSLPNWLMDAEWWTPVDGSGRYPSAFAPIIFMWLYNKVTEIAPEQPDGIRRGVVLGGTPVSYMDIASTIGCSWSAVQRAVKHLTGKKLIEAERTGRVEYRFIVPNCRKQFKETGFLEDA